MTPEYLSSTGLEVFEACETRHHPTPLPGMATSYYAWHQDTHLECTWGTLLRNYLVRAQIYQKDTKFAVHCRCECSLQRQQGIFHSFRMSSLITTPRRLSVAGAPHWGLPHKVPAAVTDVLPVFSKFPLQTKV